MADETKIRSFPKTGSDKLDAEGKDHAISAYVTELFSRAVECARRRIDVEERWYQDTLQYQGYYSDEIREELERRKNASKLFVNQTRPKCNVMRDRLIEILFPKGEANWDIFPMPAANLDREAGPEPAQGQGSPEAGSREAAARSIRDAIAKQSMALRKEMARQLENCRYTEVGELVLNQVCKLGTGVCKGPFSDGYSPKVWTRTDGRKWHMRREKQDQPRFEWVDVWNFFPDMDGRTISECEYTFQLHRLSRSDMRRALREGDFDERTVKYLLDQDPEFMPLEEQFTQYTRHLKALDQSSTDGQEYRYMVFEYHGPVPYPTLERIAEKMDRSELFDSATNPENPAKTVDAVIWFCQDRVLRFGLKPDEGDDPSYSVVTLEDSDASIFGVGIATMLRDPQAALNSAWRMQMENAGLSGVPMAIIDQQQLKPVNGKYSIGPGKLWWRIESDEQSAPPLEMVGVEGNSQNLQLIVESAMRFMDDESRLPLVAQGDPGTSAQQTAHGMSLLVSAVNIVFKSAAKRFDRMFTLPNIRRLYNWNMQFGEDEMVKGAYQVKALGAEVLLVREMQAQNLLMVLNLAASNPLLSDMIRIPSLARKLFQALQIENADIVLSDEELDQLAEAAAEQPPQPDPADQIKLQIEEMKQAAETQRLQMQLQLEMVKLAQQSEVSLTKISADLQKAAAELRGKERLMAAEFAVKEQHGTGI